MLTIAGGAVIGFVEAIGVVHNYPCDFSHLSQLFFILSVLIIETLVVLFICISIVIPFSFISSVKAKSPFLFVVMLLVIIGYGVSVFFTIPRGIREQLSPIPVQDNREQLNIVLVVIDTLRQDRMGCYGNAAIKTPGADVLSKHGVLFSQVISQIPITAPSHASIFTGLYPYEHGSRYNGIPMFRHLPVLAEILARAGYFPAAFVSSTAVKGDVTGLRRGFHVYDEQFFVDNINPQYMFVFPVKIFLKVFGIRSAERRAAVTNRRLISSLPLLTQNAPFFLWLHYYDPHIPYIPLSPYDKMYDPEYDGRYKPDLKTLLDFREKKITLTEREQRFFVAQYDGEVSFADRAFEEVYTSFQQHYPTEFKKTVFILTSDHGESLTEHDYYFYHGEKLYDQSLLVPLIVSQPAVSSSGKIRQNQVLLLDLFATVLDFAGEEIPEHVGSTSLKPMLDPNYNTKTKPQKYALAENGFYFFLNKGDHDLHLDTKSFSLRSEQWKYIVHPDGIEELYDLNLDPGEGKNSIELENQASQFRENVMKLKPALVRSERVQITTDPSTINDLKSLGYIQKGEDN